MSNSPLSKNINLNDENMTLTPEDRSQIDMLLNAENKPSVKPSATFSRKKSTKIRYDVCGS